MPVLPITSLYAALLVFLSVFLSFFVIFKRWKLKILIGDNNNPEMLKAIRSHGNFHEYVPLALIIMGLCELQGMGHSWLHGLGLSLFVGRIFHVLGITQFKGVNPFRFLGMNATFFMMLIGGVYLLKSYFR